MTHKTVDLMAGFRLTSLFCCIRVSRREHWCPDSGEATVVPQQSDTELPAHSCCHTLMFVEELRSTRITRQIGEPLAVGIWSSSNSSGTSEISFSNRNYCVLFLSRAVGVVT
ncbi:hypothetical protein BaRGS_00026582 [Batillaria attramentaria]|uniref:Secreted protein n=1 Tax=Batillaria attramentaria TaxID=370345 RepID=A0ABD0K5K9_9CAEN